MASNALMLVNCATTSDKAGEGDDGDVKEVDKSEQDDGDRGKQSGSTFVNSLSNSSMTSWTVKRSRAESISKKLLDDAKGSDEKMKELLSSLVATQRLSGQNFPAVLETGRRLADVELKAGANKEIPDTAKLEIALAAAQASNFAMFDFMITPLLTSKDSKIRAGALNALGVITLDEGRVPEAVQYFKKALKSDSDYRPAMLNLGFVALQYGDLDTAKSMLTRVRQDWFAKSALLVIARQSGDKSETTSLCTKLLPRSHKPTVFNCGLNEWLSNNSSAKARDLINKALKLKGGPPSWDEKGYEALNNIRGS
jgi:lipopolysaccharide biosynthesis regulator YciM